MSIISASVVLACAHVSCTYDSRPTAGNEKTERMNVILVSLDTLRADSLGVYGNKGHNSPSIDALARKSTVYLDTLASSPWTLPSHASMFTGLYPSNHAAHCGYVRFTRDTRTIAQLLKASGFETISFNGGGNVGRQFGFARGFSVYKSFEFAFGLSDKVQYARSDPMLPMKEGVAWIRRRALDKNGGRPFFLFLHSYEPHAPYYSRRDDSFTSVRALIESQRSASAPARDKARRDYEGGVQWADGHVGELDRALRETGLEKNTILMLTSDHGEAFLEHGFVLHSIKLYPEFLRVPLLIFDPRNPVGKTSSKPASIVDIKPTLLDLLGMKPDAAVDGVSLVREVDEDRLRFAEVCFDPGASNRLLRSGIVTIRETSSKMVAHRNHRLILNDQRDTFELYDIEADPMAATNLIDTDIREAERLKTALRRWIAATRYGSEKPSAGAETPGTQALSNEQVEQLKALGYIDSGK